MNNNKQTINKDVKLSTGRAFLFWILYIPLTFLGAAIIGDTISNSIKALEDEAHMVGSVWVITLFTCYKPLKLLFAKFKRENFIQLIGTFVGCISGCIIFIAFYTICKLEYNVSDSIASIIALLGIAIHNCPE